MKISLNKIQNTEAFKYSLLSEFKEKLNLFHENVEIVNTSLVAQVESSFNSLERDVRSVMLLSASFIANTLTDLNNLRSTNYGANAGFSLSIEYINEEERNHVTITHLRDGNEVSSVSINHSTSLYEFYGSMCGNENWVLLPWRKETFNLKNDYKNTHGSDFFEELILFKKLPKSIEESQKLFLAFR